MKRIVQGVVSAGGDLLDLVTQPLLIAFLPAVVLGSIWFGLPGAMAVAAVALPVVAVATRGGGERRLRPSDPATGLPTEAEFLRKLAESCNGQQRDGRTFCLCLIDIRDLGGIAARHSPRAVDCVLHTVAQRIAATTRRGDTCARLADGTLAVLTARSRRLTPEGAEALALRILDAAQRPIPWQDGQVPVTVAVGAAVGTQVSPPTSRSVLDAALIAREDAVRDMGVAVFSDRLRRSAADRRDLAAQLRHAFEDGQIEPWYQPQLCARTGRLAGFEALARWQHPERGVIPPAQFLDALETAGLMARLGETMLFHGLAALRAWDRAGLAVDTIGVNFSDTELRDPSLAERVRWELDRFDLAPQRLCVEILETVVAEGAEDLVCRNVEALSKLGCRIDLDDFGTGHASITNIRRFAITRLKIDRSFVAGVEKDGETRKMAAAILTMAQQMGLETLAEGVETRKAQDTMEALGCNFVQGFGIGRPMPFEDTIPWIHAHLRGTAKTSSELAVEPGPR